MGKRFPRGGVGGEGYLHAGSGDPGGDALPRLEIPKKGTESKLTLPKVWEEGGEGAIPPPGPLRPRRTKKRKTKRVDFGLGAILDLLDQ